MLEGGGFLGDHTLGMNRLQAVMELAPTDTRQRVARQHQCGRLPELETNAD